MTLITPFTALAPHTVPPGPADHFDSVDVLQRQIRVSQLTPPNVWVYTRLVRQSGPTARREQALKPRLDMAHLLESICATSTPGDHAQQVGNIRRTGVTYILLRDHEHGRRSAR